MCTSISLHYDDIHTCTCLWYYVMPLETFVNDTLLLISAKTNHELEQNGVLVLNLLSRVRRKGSH